ncbi:MAG TPA: immunoglobulin domain-containing protein, partial [Verrucomicrobiae bacterium]|nr:immunoglobulin domain-containing protein [Verrucomicrobiae bacterium]
GLKISFDLDSRPLIYTTGTDQDWGCINIGASQANQLVNVNQAVPHFGILFRAAGTIQAFVGNAVVSPSPEPVYTTNPRGVTNHIELVLTDADGNPFDGVGDTKIEVFVNGGDTSVYTHTVVGGFADNYFNLQANGVSHFDNLTVTQLPEAPLPAIANPSFEADTFTVFPGYVSGNGPITGWASAGGAGINPGGGSPFADNGAIPDGTQVAFIQEDSALSQVVDGFVVGRTYQLRYYENARNGNRPYLAVAVGGNTVVADHEVNSVGGANPYREVISDPFVAGASSLEIAFIKSNPLGGDNTVLIDNVGFLPSGTPPSITGQPQSQIVGLGDNATFTVSAVGSAPLSYQWFFDGIDIPGANAATLTFPVTSGDQAGAYTVEVSNATGSETSAPATLTVRAKVPGLFNTGVDDNGVALPDDAVDPHYQLVVNADNPDSTEARVQDSTQFPIVTGPWLANNAQSKWIGPRFFTEMAAGLAQGDGLYVYRTTFDLTGFDISSVVITGGWAVDNDGVSIRVNGQPTGLSNTAGFGGLTPFTLNIQNAAFVEGMNTLEFEVRNADAVAGYTGLRVANLRGLAPLPGTPPSILTQPQSQIAGTGENVVLTVVADGSSPLSYQWTKDGVEVPGGTGPTLTLNNVSLD